MVRKEVLWVEQEKVSMLESDISLLTDLSPILKAKFLRLGARFQVRVTDMKYGDRPDLLVEDFLEMLRVIKKVDLREKPFVPSSKNPVHRDNVERVIRMAAEFEMKNLTRLCLSFLNDNCKDFTITDLIRIGEIGKVDTPKALAYARLYGSEETETPPRYMLNKRFKEHAQSMDDEKTREFVLNAAIRRPGSALRRRELCQDRCRLVDPESLRCKMCEYRVAPPTRASNYYSRRRVLCRNGCAARDGPHGCTRCDHPRARSLQGLEAMRRFLCSNNCSYFDFSGFCRRCEHPRRAGDTKRKALCRNACFAFDAFGRCTTCNHRFGARGIQDLVDKRWRLCRNNCANFDVYNCCKVCEYPRQPTPALRRALCGNKCFQFVQTGDGRRVCVVCRNAWAPGQHF